jgi:hypothetical protein
MRPLPSRLEVVPAGDSGDRISAAKWRIIAFIIHQLAEFSTAEERERIWAGVSTHQQQINAQAAVAVADALAKLREKVDLS